MLATELISKTMEELKKHEGLRLKPYKCTAGALTIGYGRNLNARGISRAEAHDMLAHDVIETYHQCELKIDFWSSLSDVHKMVLLNMAFNLGIQGLLGFKRTLDYMRSGDFRSASVEMLDSKWAEQVGKRAEELSKMMRVGST